MSSETQLKKKRKEDSRFVIPDATRDKPQSRIAHLSSETQLETKRMDRIANLSSETQSETNHEVG